MATGGIEDKNMESQGNKSKSDQNSQENPNSDISRIRFDENRENTIKGHFKTQNHLKNNKNSSNIPKNGINNLKNRKDVAISVSSSKGIEISVCAAMAKVGAYNYEEINILFSQTFERIGTGQKDLFSDQSRFYNTENVKKKVESRGHDIMFLSQYSP
ncbi:hypothetical protein RF11_12602 [Thelohanellus kitauei]|uniref:Tc1-like transposase DDE domain-containing protein n=1 Tax=Thelohanellus kitauei TaxID=669202 RepID=A0A0C2NAT5_THEKT|nr:hypothetical protein RF11_12602 [Thelohanellus kitauei]